MAPGRARGVSMSLIEVLGPNMVPMVVVIGVLILSLTVAVVALLSDY